MTVASRRVKSVEIGGSEDWSDKHNGTIARVERVYVTVSLLILGIRRKRSSRSPDLLIGKSATPR